MAIETTFMRYGHGQSGITGITLKPEKSKFWHTACMHATASWATWIKWGIKNLHQLKLKLKLNNAGKHFTTNWRWHKSSWSITTHRACERCYRGNCDSSSSQCRQCNTRRQDTNGVIWKQLACWISHQNVQSRYRHVGDEKNTSE